jgi:hypothetical protein
MSLLFAATYPERVSALILGSASARWPPAPGYPCGEGFEEMYQALRVIGQHRWGQGDSIDWYLPSRAGSAHARQLFARFERMAISPSAFLRMLAMIRESDVRSVLPAIHVPTLVIHRLQDRITPPCDGRYLASHIADARYLEQPGDHSLRFAGGGDIDALCAEIGDFLSGQRGKAEPDRALATVVVIDAGQDAAEARRQVSCHGGRLLHDATGQVRARFAVPGQAVGVRRRCSPSAQSAAPRSARRSMSAK